MQIVNHGVVFFLGEVSYASTVIVATTADPLCQ